MSVTIFLRTFAFSALAVLTACSEATGVSEFKWNGNAYFWTSVGGFNPGDKVSGTNINLPFDGGVALMADEDPMWTSVQLLYMTVKLTGMPDQTLYPPMINPNTMSKTLRFASTHYADGSTVTVEIIAHVALSNDSISSPDDVSCTMNLEIYNKGLVLATKEDFDGNSTYTVNSPPNSQGYAENAINAMPYAKSNLQAMNHTLLNPSGNHFLRESDLASDGYLHSATACFFFTHGNPGYFRSSEIDELHFEYNGSNEVRSYVMTGRTCPIPNIIVMHACSTVGGSGNTQYHAPYAFGVSNIPSPITGKGYCGFTVPVYSLTVGGTLAQHAQIIYDKLANGWTLRRAVDLANELGPIAEGGVSLKMVIRGDAAAKLVGVYTGDWTVNNTNWWAIL